MKKATQLYCVDSGTTDRPYVVLYTNMNKTNGLHHMKEHPQISNFL